MVRSVFFFSGVGRFYPKTEKFSGKTKKHILKTEKSSFALLCKTFLTDNFAIAVHGVRPGW